MGENWITKNKFQLHYGIHRAGVENDSNFFLMLIQICGNKKSINLRKNVFEKIFKINLKCILALIVCAWQIYYMYIYILY